MGLNLSESLKISMQSLNAAFFKPNTLFLSIDGNNQHHKSIIETIDIARQNNYGVLLYVPFENVGLSLEKDITLWLKDFPSTWKATYNINNNDLSILTAFLLQNNWKGNLKVKVAIDNLGMKSDEDIILLNDLVRFPIKTTINQYLQKDELDLLISNRTDLNIIPLTPNLEIDEMLKIVEFTKTSAIFCLDSETENALV